MYIDVCYCDMFSVVNVYLDHLKFCVGCINSRRIKGLKIGKAAGPTGVVSEMMKASGNRALIAASHAKHSIENYHRMWCLRGCGVSRRYIDVCYCDMFSVVNVYLDHLKFCVVCINSRRYVCCSECDVVSNECNEPTSCLVQPIGSPCCEVMYFGCFG